jgi:hypothetical protein
VNPRNALRLAWIFCLSAARAKRARGGSPEGLAKKPITNVYMSLVVFTLAAVFVYLVLGVKMEALTVNMLASQLNVFLPAFTVFMSMVYSLMTEFSVSSETASTDIVNWLPIQAGDFVVGSVLTTIYFVSPMVSILFGVAFGLSFRAGSLDIWALSAALGVLGCFLGAMALEIVRGAMNRASGAFSGMKGQGAVILRMVLSVAIIVMISMMFNFSMMMRVVGWFSSGVEGIRYVPVFWPSMLVLKQSSGDQAGALVYSALTGLLLVAVYYASVRVREMYWVPAPVSLKLKPVRISRSRGLLFFDSGEAALIRKDLKSLLRRREMVYMLAIPVMIVLMGLLGTPPDVLMDPSVPLETKTTFLLQCAMGIIVLTLQMALAAFGQEREAFMTLLASPIDASRLLRAKAVAAFIPALPALAIFTALFSYVAATDAVTAGALIVVGLTMLIAVSSVELAVGARFAVFTGDGRARFVTQEGRLIGLLLCVATVGAVSSPLALHFLWGRLSMPVSLVLTEAFTIAMAMVGFRAARGELEKLYEYNY